MSPRSAGGQPRGDKPERKASGAAGRVRGGAPSGGRASGQGRSSAGQGRGSAGQGGGRVRATPTRSGRTSRAETAAADGAMVEGRQAVRELLRAGRRPVRQLLVSETAAQGGPLAEILELADAAGVAVRLVGRDHLQRLATTDAPQGVVAIADPLPERELADLLVRPPGGPPPFLVVLDGVTDPHNVGAVLRSALCAGATGAVVGRHRSAGLTAAAVKAAAGAAEWLPVATVAGIPSALAELSAGGVWTVGLDAGEQRPLWSLDLGTEPVAVVLGAEGDGMSRLSQQRCDVVVGIPMLGPLGSLNVAAAASLACFEIARRRS